MKRALSAALIMCFGLAAIGGPVLYKAWRGAIDRNRLQQAAEPFRIAGNLYYIGTSDTSVFLITGPAGHVILDGADRNTDFVLASVAKLGFDIKDVKALINSSPGQAAGLAELQKASGAQLAASEASAGVIAKGGQDPENALPRQLLGHVFGVARYTPARVDRRVRDGETVRVGPIALTAHITPGVSRGCTSWSCPVVDGGRVLNVVSACSLIRETGVSYPGQDADLERSFDILQKLPVDIWVTSRSRLWNRYRKFTASRTAKNPVDPFVDPAGYRAYISDAEDALRRGIVN